MYVCCKCVCSINMANVVCKLWYVEGVCVCVISVFSVMYIWSCVVSVVCVACVFGVCAACVVCGR